MRVTGAWPPAPVEWYVRWLAVWQVGRSSAAKYVVRVPLCVLHVLVKPLATIDIPRLKPVVIGRLLPVETMSVGHAPPRKCVPYVRYPNGVEGPHLVIV